MGLVTLLINGRPYDIGCEDGDEGHLHLLAAEVDKKVRMVAGTASTPGEARLILMAALMMAEDVQRLRVDLADFEQSLARLADRFDRLAESTVAALTAAAARLDAIEPETASAFDPGAL